MSETQTTQGQTHYYIPLGKFTFASTQPGLSMQMGTFAIPNDCILVKVNGKETFLAKSGENYVFEEEVRSVEKMAGLDGKCWFEGKYFGWDKKL